MQRHVVLAPKLLAAAYRWHISVERNASQR